MSDRNADRVRWWLLSGVVGLVLTMTSAFASNIYGEVQDLKRSRAELDKTQAVLTEQTKAIRETTDELKKGQRENARKMDELKDLILRGQPRRSDER